MITSSPFPTEAQHFEGRYKSVLGVALILIGAVTILLNLWRTVLDDQLSRPIVIGLVLGILVALLGVLYFTRPYFRVAPNRLTVYNLIGKAVKRHPFASFGHLKIEGNRLYVESSYAEESGHRQRVKIKRWLVKSDDWQRLEVIAHSSNLQP